MTPYMTGLYYQVIEFFEDFGDKREVKDILSWWNAYVSRCYCKSTHSLSGSSLNYGLHAMLG